MVNIQAPKKKVKKKTGDGTNQDLVLGDFKNRHTISYTSDIPLWKYLALLALVVGGGLQVCGKIEGESADF